jgi:hypothetical protein
MWPVKISKQGILIFILAVIFSTWATWHTSHAQVNNTNIYGMRATTGSIGGGALLAGACTSGTVAVTGATTGMVVGTAPVTYPGDGTVWFGYVSANGTVTIKVCAILALTPTASAYNVTVFQ